MCESIKGPLAFFIVPFLSRRVFGSRDGMPAEAEKRRFYAGMPERAVMRKRRSMCYGKSI